MTEMDSVARPLATMFIMMDHDRTFDKSEIVFGKKKEVNTITRGPCSVRILVRDSRGSNMA